MYEHAWQVYRSASGVQVPMRKRLSPQSALHCRGCDAPPAHHVPAGQSRHVLLRDVVLRYVPGLHEAGIGTTEPLGHVYPSSHATHAVAPSSPWYLPSSHAEHSWLRASLAWVPALQLEAAVEPAKQNVPAGHSVHSSALATPVVLLHVPPGHGLEVLAAGSQ